MYLSQIKLRATTKRKFNIMNSFWRGNIINSNGFNFYFPMIVLKKFEFDNFVQLSRYVSSNEYKREGYPMEVFSTRLRTKDNRWEYLPMEDMETRRNELITASGLELRVKKFGEDRGSARIRFGLYEKKAVLISMLIPLLHSDIFNIQIKERIRQENDTKLKRMRFYEKTIAYIGIWAPQNYVAMASAQDLLSQ